MLTVAVDRSRSSYRENNKPGEIRKKKFNMLLTGDTSVVQAGGTGTVWGTLASLTMPQHCS